MARTAAALIIGNEILSGKTEDVNSPFLARELRELGVELRRILVVPDEPEEIARAVRAFAPAHDFVFTSGGVGPTHDDVTLEAVALALGRRLVRHPDLASLIARYHDIASSPHALRMADLPEGTVLLSAEGLKVPVVVVDNLYVLPGVPQIFRRKFTAIRERFREAPFHLRVVEVGAGEVEIAGELYSLLERFPGLLLGSYPASGEASVQVRLTLESKDPGLVDRALAELLARLPPGAVRGVT